jgi:hypothetical protein
VDNILKDLLRRKLSPAGGAVAFPVDHVPRQEFDYCAFGPPFRASFAHARAYRGRVVKPTGARWVCAHFRWGDKQHASRAHGGKLWLRPNTSALLPLAGVVSHALGVVGEGATAHFFSEGAAHEFEGFSSRVAGATLHLGGGGAQGTQDDLDALSQCDVLVSMNSKGNQNFFVLAAHLCTRCVVVAPGIRDIPGFVPAAAGQFDNRATEAWREVAVPPYHQLVDASVAQQELAPAWSRLQASATRGTDQQPALSTTRTAIGLSFKV